MRTYDLSDLESPALPSCRASAPVARFLPEPLIRARAAVFDPLNCLDINMTARRALYGVLAFFNLAHPTKEVFASRDVLRAEALLQSSSTLYRGLADLQTSGYIVRRQLRRHRPDVFGQYHISQIFLTEKALVLLGLKKVIHNSRHLKMEDGLQDKELTKRNKSSSKSTAGQPDSPQKAQIDRATSLPVDLVPLLRLHVKKSEICYLMKLARTSGKMLSDVVKVVGHRVEHLRGRAVVAYLRAMLDKHLDYAWLAKEQSEQAKRARQEEGAKAKLAALDQRYDGYAVVDQAGQPIGVFVAASTPTGTHVIQGSSGSMPVNLTFVRAWAAGKIHLRPPEVF